MKDNLLKQEPLVSPEEKTASSKPQPSEALASSELLETETESEEPTPRTIPPDPLQLSESDGPIL